MESVPRGPELPSQRVENDLRARIEAGEWDHDEKLPGHDELAAHYGVSRRTINKVMGRLADDGLVTIVRGWGTFRR